MPGSTSAFPAFFCVSREEQEPLSRGIQFSQHGSCQLGIYATLSPGASLKRASSCPAGRQCSPGVGTGINQVNKSAGHGVPSQLPLMYMLFDAIYIPLEKFRIFPSPASPLSHTLFFQGFAYVMDACTFSPAASGAWLFASTFFC